MRTHWSQQIPSFNSTRYKFKHGHHQMVNNKIRLIIFFAAEDGRSSIQSAKQNWELTVAQTMNSLLQNSVLNIKKIWEITRPFMYDLNQIPYDYTVVRTNRFKGLYLIECLKNYGWRFVTLYRRQGSRLSPRQRNAKGKMAG